MKDTEVEEVVAPPKWVPFEKGLCDSCWATCCHGMAVEVSVPDLMRLKLLTDEEASGSLLTVARKLHKKGLIRGFRAQTLLFTLQQKPSGDCIFLGEDRRCTVYKQRPEICRQFPKIGPRPGHCPYQEKDKHA